MQMNNMPLQSLARLTCGFGVTDLREALEGRSNTSNSAIAQPPSISTLGSGGTPSPRFVGSKLNNRSTESNDLSDNIYGTHNR